MERPIPSNRWDNPIFELRFDEENPLESIGKTV